MVSPIVLPSSISTLSNGEKVRSVWFHRLTSRLSTWLGRWKSA
jgi:hypothetical protein